MPPEVRHLDPTKTYLKHLLKMYLFGCLGRDSHSIFQLCISQMHESMKQGESNLSLKWKTPLQMKLDDLSFHSRVAFGLPDPKVGRAVGWDM